jgi:hypothetical protein
MNTPKQHNTHTNNHGQPWHYHPRYPGHYPPDLARAHACTPRVCKCPNKPIQPQIIQTQAQHNPLPTITIQPPLQPQRKRKRKRNPRDDNPQTPDNQAPIPKNQKTQTTPTAPITLQPTTTTRFPHRKRKHNPPQDDLPEGLPPKPKRQRPSTHHMNTRCRAPSPAGDILQSNPS